MSDVRVYASSSLILFQLSLFFFILLLYKKRITLVIIGIYSIASRFNEFTKIPGTVQVWSTYTSRCRNTVKQAVTRIAGNNDRKIEYAFIAAPFFWVVRSFLERVSRFAFLFPFLKEISNDLRSRATPTFNLSRESLCLNYSHARRR